MTLDGEKERVGQGQIHDLLFGDQLSWQAILYDLINTEQLDPWDLDLSVLAGKFLEKVHSLEEANFFVSSKVLLAASLLLRMKSELLLERDIRDLDDVLFNRQKDKEYKQERIELEEDVPELVVRTPLPRFKKVTLQQLIKALDTAISTENRRIKKISLEKQQEFETAMALPKRRINVQNTIKEIYKKLEGIFENRETRVAFTELVGKSKEDKIANFLPLLHLDSQHKIWIEQDDHFDEIWILLKELYEKQNASQLEEMRKEVEAELAEFEKEEKISEIEEGLEDN